MSTPKSTIELNGKVYDAATGQVVKSGGAVDGFIRSSGATSVKAPAKSAATTKPASMPPAVQPVAVSAHKSRPHNPHKPERSQTLMRHVVSKPAPTADDKIARTGKTAGHTVQTKEAAPVVAPGQRLTERQQRANQVAKSKSISRFSTGTVSPKPTVAKLHVQPHPEAAPPITTAEHKAHHAAHHEARHAKATDFENALAHATSHKQAPLKKRPAHHRAARKLHLSPRSFTVFAACLVAILLAGLIAYQNAPAISMRLAAAKAGFQASLPSYTPAGFAINSPIVTSPGQVAVSFHSNSDDRAFQIIQKPSNWTSESLLSNFVANSKKSYQTLQDKGKTIYIYGGSNATWVNGGVWYQITGNANLNSDQLLRLADTL